MTGEQSICFEKPPYLFASASVAGKKEGEGPLGEKIDLICEDPMLGEENWEKAESMLQIKAIQLALEKAGKMPQQIRYIFAGDLLGQLIATSFGVEELEIPLFGLYGYGNQRPLSATWTVTGSGAFLLSTQKSHAKITGITTGKVVDYGVRDSLNMGACMAPAAADTICQNLMDFNRQPQDYDRIITGDLGYVGQTILLELLKEKGFDIKKQHMDCGIEIYDRKLQDTHSGGSGCGCSAVTLSAMILPKIEKGDWKRILFVPTGALLSTVSFNEGQTVPGIAHAVVIEHC